MPATSLTRLLRLAFLSALILYLEMLLIRWVGTELRVFAYLQNGVLVAAFLGLGLGCRNSRETVRLLPAMLALTLVAFVIRDPWGWGLGEGVTQGLIAFQESAVWYQARSNAWPEYVRSALVIFALATSLGLLAAIAFTFRPLGQWLGAWMDEYPQPIAAYSANILGSLAGIGLFVAATVSLTSPFTWLLVAAVGLAACATWARDGRLARVAAIGVALALPLWAPSGGRTTLWSPYQKLTIAPLLQEGIPNHPKAACGEVVNVNNVSYQIMADLDPKRMAAAPDLYPPQEILRSPYIFPYTLIGHRDDVLVVGAGSGNDAAAALRAGARSVRAVEIDPTIVEIGRARHPNRPYSSDRVTVTVDDARAFFRSKTGPYDLIWFGLLDSHTAPSAYANVRLDHFVYTRESFKDMKRLLRPMGVVVLFFQPQTNWIADRLVRLLAESFGQPPLAMYVKGASTVCLGSGGLLLIAGSEQSMAAIRARVASTPEFSARVINPRTFPMEAEITTDDWPYLYLKAPSVPRYHMLVALACLGLGVFLRRRLFPAGAPVNPGMLLLGMGFMLLEVAGVSRAALLFGSTWTVNAYVVGAIFAMALLANLVAMRTTIRPTRWAAAGLMLSILALAFIPTSVLAGLPFSLRVIAGGALVALPVFFSGLIFVTTWAAIERKDLALGSNILGSLLGGVASMLSMAIGFRDLTLITLAIYFGALLILRRGESRGGLVGPTSGT